MLDPPRFFLVRGSDLVLLGAAWTGCTVEGDRLVASGGASVILTFPPQALAEAKSDVAGTGRRDARLAGLSSVRLQLPAGASIPLTVDGLLGALAAAPVLDSELELPFGLVGAVRPAGAGEVRAEHVAGALVAPSGTTSLWRLPLRATGVLALQPIRLGADDGGLDVTPLSAGERGQIVANGQVDVTRLELTALGGTLTAGQRAETFGWDHDLALGRDQRVHVERQGVLHPLGHRATLSQFAERRVEGGVAALQRTSELRVTESLRVMADDGTVESRSFPFSSVELLTTRVTELAPPVWDQFLRSDDTVQPLRDERAALDEPLAVAGADFAAFSVPTDVFQLANAGDQDARELLDVVWPGIEEREQVLAEADAANAAASTDRPGPPFLPFVERERIRQEIAALRQDEARLQAIADARLAELAPLVPLLGNVDALADAGVGVAVVLRDLRRQAAACDAAIAAASLPLDRSFVPRAPDGSPVLFQARCAGALGDVGFALPLVFVNDLVVEPDEHFGGYRALDDPALSSVVEAQLGPRTEVVLPGVGVDLVRAPERRSADVQEVHGLSLAGVHQGRTFRPVLREVQVELPELRHLLPGLPTRAPLTYADAFIQGGQPTDAPLRIAGGLPVDFDDATDRAGGFLSPSFTADAISRTFGPVDSRALPGAADALAAFDGMRLLGASLRSLLPPGTPPPEIQQLLADGKPPGVRLSWPDIALRSASVFQAHQIDAEPPVDTTRLDLLVERSPDASSVRCELDAFTLALPPGDSALLVLGFESLAFDQRGAEPPTLDVGDVVVRFAGALELLGALQDAAKVLGTAPRLDHLPDGLRASYVLQVPTVTAGTFSLRDVAVRIEVDIPFRGGSPSVFLGFASRSDPFHLNVLTFGGGGYLELRVDGAGLRQLEASLDFGASVDVDFKVASGEVHALGGVRYAMSGSDVRLSGFLRFGGSVEVLGLVSVSVELVLELEYDSDRKALVGRATLVIEIDLTLYSDSVELDSGEWVLVGGHDPLVPALGPGRTSREGWDRYQGAYA